MATNQGHLPALDHDPVVHEDALAVLSRMVEHYRNSSTDLAPGLWREPAASYCDPDLWSQELAAVHRSVPLPLALSCELTEPGAYKSMDVAGTPVLITRTQSGEVHAVINACRHRGAELVPAGVGVVKRLICPYHSWCYDLSGRLVGVEDENTFGDVDRDDMGLVSLPVAERAGLVFVCLTPGAPMDVETWLGAELTHLLEALDLQSCHHHSRRALDGPNWKVVLDGYLESYHIGTAHRDSVLLTHLSNMATFDSWGPHMRNSFALRTISAASERPIDASALPATISAVYWLFPGLNISGGWGNQIAVSLVLPGRSWDVSHTEQHILLRHEPQNDAAREAADQSADRLREVVLDEDYEIGYGVQRGLPAMKGQDFVIGRNEPAVQHLHRAIAHRLNVAAEASLMSS